MSRWFSTSTEADAWAPSSSIHVIARRRPGAISIDDRLVGYTPRLEISGGVVTLTALERPGAQVRAAAFDLAPELVSQIRPGDVLHLRRSGCGGVGVCVTRDGRLLVGVGAIVGLTTAPVRLRPGSERLVPHVDNFFGPTSRYWVEFSVENGTRVLRDGEEAMMGAYGCSVVHVFQQGFPGTDACVFVYRLDEKLRECALESAALLSRRSAGMRLERW